MKKVWIGICVGAILCVALSSTEAATGSAFGIVPAPKDIALGPDVTLSLGGALRLRYEFTDNFTLKWYGRGEGDGYLLERLWIDADFRFGDVARTFIRFQDARVWDYSLPREAFKSHPQHDEAELHEAFIELKGSPQLPLGVKVGRQRIYYGDNRIFGPATWANTGRWVWDAAKLLYASPEGKFMADAFYGRTVIHYPEDFNLEHRHEFEGYGVYSTIDAMPEITLDLFYVGKRDDHLSTTGESGPAGKLNIHNVGLRVGGKALKSWDYGATFVRQFGDWGPDDIEAWGAHAGIGYTFPSCPWQPRLGLDLAYGSGDSDPQDGKHESFDTIFGARDKLYGRMNLFNWKNLENWQFSLTTKPIKKKLKVRLDYHLFYLAEERDAWYGPEPKARRDREGTSGDEVGQEFDLTVSYKVSQSLRLMGGYCHFFAGDFIENTGPSDDADWVFLQVEHTF